MVLPPIQQQVLSGLGYMPCPDCTAVALRATPVTHISIAQSQPGSSRSTAIMLLQTTTQVVDAPCCPTTAVMLTVSDWALSFQFAWSLATSSNTMTVEGRVLVNTSPSNVTDGGSSLPNFTRVAAGQPTAVLSTENLLSSVEPVVARDPPDIPVNNSNLCHMPAALPSGNISQPGGRATSALVLDTGILQTCNTANNETHAALPPGTTGQPGEGPTPTSSNDTFQPYDTNTSGEMA